MFVNRTEELSALHDWWESGSPLGVVRGRRRVGKSWLLSHFAEGLGRTVIHTGRNRTLGAELSIFSDEVVRQGLHGTRDLAHRPFVSWDEAIDGLAALALERPILVVLDEFPELLKSDASLDSALRSIIDRLPSPAPIRFLLCGSEVRTMEILVEERNPLFGRSGMLLQVHPFRPHEAAQMLPDLRPSDRALVWGLLGGVPLYLSWWDQTQSISENLLRLVCRPSGRLLNEGQLLLATEGDSSGLVGPVLVAIAGGRTKFSEIKDAVRTDPTRTLDRLAEIRLVERTVPVTEDPVRSRRPIYQISDNFLAFWLGIIDRYRTEIDRDLGRSILPVVLASLDDFMGGRWEEAFRMHLRLLASQGRLGPVVSVGRFWSGGGDEIDAVCLAGRNREAVLVGESKWARTVQAANVESVLARKSAALPRIHDPLRIALCARDEVVGAAPSTLVVTSADIFGRS